MAEVRGVEHGGCLAGVPPCSWIGYEAARRAADALVPGTEVSPLPRERRSYLLTVTEGPWDDWFVSVAVADERGRRIALVVKDDMSLEVLLPDLLVEAEEAIVADFLARRPRPGWLEELRRALICRSLWMRNLWRGRRSAENGPRRAAQER